MYLQTGHVAVAVVFTTLTIRTETVLPERLGKRHLNVLRQILIVHLLK